MSNGQAKRAQTFGELHDKLNELKGQKLPYEKKQLRKNLKNRIKKKSKRDERLQQKKLARTEQNTTAATKIKTEDVEVPKTTRAKPVFNSEGNMVFSKFDFSDMGEKKKTKTEKDPKKILQQLKDKKEKIRELEESGETDKAKEIKEKDAWKNVLAKASGEKVI